MEFKGSRAYPENRQERKLVAELGLEDVADAEGRRYVRIPDFPMTAILARLGRNSIDEDMFPVRPATRSLREMAAARRDWDSQHTAEGFIVYDDKDPEER